MTFDIAVILINYNSSEYSINCINSIIEKTSKDINYQIIITDNCSKIEDFENLKTYCDAINFPHIKLQRNKINSGFGGGNMMGYNCAHTKYVAFINNDTILLNDCLSILKTAIEKEDKIAIVGGQPYTKKGKQMIGFDHFDSLTKELFGRDFLEKINSKKYPKRKSEYTDPLKVNYIQGSFMFIKSTDFNDVGGFDTNIFLYYEETDLSMRLKKKGKSSYLIPEAKYIHYHGCSTPKSIEIKTELKISLLYIIRKHYGFFNYYILLNHLRFVYLFSTIFKPNYWYLLKVLLSGAPLSNSLKTKQTIKQTNF